MVIDSSAVIAILFDEPECEALLSQIAAAGACRLSAATLVEIGIVLRRDVAGQRRAAFGEMSRPFSITIEPVSEGQGLLGPRRLRSVRQGHRSSGRPELRRLFQLRPRETDRRTASVQGSRFHSHRPRGRMLIGYTRVSKGDEQSNALQAKALEAAGFKRVFEEAASGGRWDRPILHDMLRQLREG